MELQVPGSGNKLQSSEQVYPLCAVNAVARNDPPLPRKPAITSRELLSINP
jgi:hypothetical protein